MELSDYLSVSEEDNKESNYLNLFYLIDESQIESILKSFSYYLSSNKNHKYNITHIIDQLPLFVEKVNVLKEKRKLYLIIKENLISLLRNKKKNCTAIFDKCFLCSTTIKNELTFVENLSFFSINELSSKTIYLQFVLESKDDYKEEFSYLLTYKNFKELLQKGSNDVLKKIELALNI